MRQKRLGHALASPCLCAASLDLGDDSGCRVEFLRGGGAGGRGGIKEYVSRCVEAYLQGRSRVVSLSVCLSVCLSVNDLGGKA